MLDVFNTNNGYENQKTFVGGIGTTPLWHTWIKPRNVKMLHIFCFGGGGGGGAGLTDVSSTNRGGGAGGVGSPITSLLIPAILVPDILYISPGSGGLGGTSSGVAGGNGLASYVSVISGSTTAANVLITSCGSNSGGGGAGTTASASAGTVSVVNINNMILASLGIWLTKSSASATNGGTGAGSFGGSASSLTLFSSNGVLCGGTGGGGCGTTDSFDRLGGDINAAGIVTVKIKGGDVAGANINGDNGIFLSQPFVCTGGAGGGSNGVGNAGNGGNGAYGCGGGGGGGGIVGGKGGNGGAGMVIITAW